jgi:hypothetical protein
MNSWVKAVKHWNSAQSWRDDFYAMPKKGGEYYDEIRELMGHPKKPAPVTDDKKKLAEITRKIQSLFFPYRQATGSEKEKIYRQILKLEEEQTKYKTEMTPTRRSEIKKFNEENDEHVW